MRCGGAVGELEVACCAAQTSSAPESLVLREREAPPPLALSPPLRPSRSALTRPRRVPSEAVVLLWSLCCACAPPPEHPCLYCSRTCSLDSACSSACSLAGSRRQLEAFRPLRSLAIERVAFSRSSIQTSLQRPLDTLGNWLRNCSFSFSVRQNPRIYAHMSTTQRMQSPPCTASERERQDRARGGGRARGRGRGRTVVEALRDLVERGLQGEEAPSVPA